MTKKKDFLNHVSSPPPGTTCFESRIPQAQNSILFLKKNTSRRRVYYMNVSTQRIVSTAVLTLPAEK